MGNKTLRALLTGILGTAKASSVFSVRLFELALTLKKAQPVHAQQRIQGCTSTPEYSLPSNYMPT
jgi:hypothetical protein